MNGKTIKTLAEYIVSLKQKRQKLDEQYNNSVTDTNGVEQDWKEEEQKQKPLDPFWPPYSRS